MICFAFSTFSFVVAVTGRPERASSPRLSRPSRNLLYHSNTEVLFRAWSPKAFCIIDTTWEHGISFLKQNKMHALWYSIFFFRLHFQNATNGQNGAHFELWPNMKNAIECTKW